MTRVLELRSYRQAVTAFSEPLGKRTAFPQPVQHLVQRIERWNDHGRKALKRLGSPPVFCQVFQFGSVVFDTHRLLGMMNRKHLDDWLCSPATTCEAKESFEQWRRAFNQRYESIRVLTADIFLSSNLNIFEHNPLVVFVRSARSLATLFADKRYVWGGMGMLLGTAVLAAREYRFLANALYHEFDRRGMTRASRNDQHLLDRINSTSPEVLLTKRHARPLRSVYSLLSERHILGTAADRIIAEALQQSNRASGKPWKGLAKLTQLIKHAGVDPRAADFSETFHSQTSSAIQYTYTPGLEWVVRDYDIGKKLLQMDGRIPQGGQTATLQQGRVSIMPGIAKATPAATEFARKYFGPVENFLDSMVTADGADHQRMRKPFMEFFSRRAVFDHADLVQATVNQLLDQAASVARHHDGQFDFRRDFAFQFPIRIICGLLGISGGDVELVQRWTEESTRSMDTEAGVSIATAKRGQKSVALQRQFFGRLLDDARKRKPASPLIKYLAGDETLSEAERLANLSVIVFAGFETTTGLLCCGVRELLRHPAQWNYLRDSLVNDGETAVAGQVTSDTALRWYRWSENEPRDADPVRREKLAHLLDQSAALRARFDLIKQQEDRLDAAIEELLRWCAPGSIIPLTASCDVDFALPKPLVIRGQQLQTGNTWKIGKGETVIVAIDEINRRYPLKAGKFDTRAEGHFDITRPENTKHLSFGVKHMCIGATLARENAKRALEGILRRFPDLEVCGTPVPQDMELFHGLASLPVRSRQATVSSGGQAGLVLDRQSPTTEPAACQLQ